MTKKIVWRLAKLPTPDELRDLIAEKIITKEEARDILFKEQEEGRDEKSLKNEIVFLRKLVEKLSQSNSQIITTIREVETPAYRTYPWYSMYDVWCGSTTTVTNSNGEVLYMDANSGIGTTMGSNETNGDLLSAVSFNSIDTFK